jgi:hypothetical protein
VLNLGGGNGIKGVAWEEDRQIKNQTSKIKTTD